MSVNKLIQRNGLTGDFLFSAAGGTNPHFEQTIQATDQCRFLALADVIGIDYTVRQETL